MGASLAWQCCREAKRRGADPHTALAPIQGIGREVVQGLRNRGMTVVAVARTESEVCAPSCSHQTCGVRSVHPPRASASHGPVGNTALPSSDKVLPALTPHRVLHTFRGPNDPG